MPKASKHTASESVKVEGYEGHFENVDGGYTVGFRTPGTEVVEFSPSDELQGTMEVVTRNMEAAGAAQS